MKYILPLFLGSLLVQSCLQTDLYEKNVSIPRHAWDYSNKPSIQFDITDTVSSYNIFVVVRHTDAFHYNNLWIRLTSTTPGDPASTTQTFDLPLSTQEKWTGTGMDDIIEHRIPLYQRPVKFLKPGKYTVTMEQVMRENPLEEIMNVGLRLEKVREP